MALDVQIRKVFPRMEKPGYVFYGEFRSKDHITLLTRYDCMIGKLKLISHSLLTCSEPSIYQPRDKRWFSLALVCGYTVVIF